MTASEKAITFLRFPSPADPATLRQRNLQQKLHPAKPEKSNWPHLAKAQHTKLKPKLHPAKPKEKNSSESIYQQSQRTNLERKHYPAKPTSTNTQAKALSSHAQRPKPQAQAPCSLAKRSKTLAKAVFSLMQLCQKTQNFSDDIFSDLIIQPARLPIRDFLPNQISFTIFS